MSQYANVATISSGGVVVPTLDSNDYLSGQTIGANALAATSILPGPGSPPPPYLLGLSSTGWSTGTFVDVHEYVAGTGYGGGRFQFVSAATACDIGYNLCPNDRLTAVAAEAQGTGTGAATFVGTINGTAVNVATVSGSPVGGTITAGQVVSTGGVSLGTLSGSTGAWVLSAAQYYPGQVVLGALYSGTLANASSTAPIQPGSVKFLVGGVTLVTDDGGGFLVSNKLIIGLINYTTGAYAFTAYIASGIAITANYNWCSSAGRLVRIPVSLFVSMAEFGAISDGNTDCHNSLQSANAYAASTNRSLLVPSPTKSAGWIARTPSIITCQYYLHETPALINTSIGTLIRFAPPVIYDQLACITVKSGVAATLVNVATFGPETSLGTPSTMMSSGWVLSTSSFQGTISGAGTTMNIVSGQTGAPNVGDQVSGAGMTNGVSTITAISGSTLTISPAQPLIATAQTFTTCGLPNYSAIQPGTVGIAITGQVKMFNCATYYHKIGNFVNSTAGHCEFHSCSFGGFIGQYIYDNSFDFSWFGGGVSGTWAGIACGNSPVIGQHGGINGTWFRLQFPLKPVLYHIYQFNDSGGNSASGITGAFYSCSFESCNEAIMQVLPGAQCNITTVRCNFDSWGTPTLPTTITPTPQQNAFSLGALLGLTSDGNQASEAGGWYASSVGAGAYPQYSLAATAAPLADSVIDLTTFGQNLNLTAGSSSVSRWVGPPRSTDAAKKGDLAAIGTYNLLKNGEIAGNWSLTGATLPLVTVSSYSASDIAGLTIPQNLVDLLGGNTNPTVIKVVFVGGNALLPAVTTALGLGTNWTRAFVVQTAASPVSISWNIGVSGGTLVNSTIAAVNIAQNSFQQILSVNSPGKNKTLTGLNIMPQNGASGTFYIIAPQMGFGDPGPYNPWPSQRTNGIIYEDNAVTATTATSGAASALPSTPAAYEEVYVNGTLYKRPLYNA